MDDLRQRLQGMQGWAVQRENLERQIELCNVDWKQRVGNLEARMLQHQEEVEARMREVTLVVEDRTRKEHEQLQAQMEAAHVRARNACDEAQRRLPEDMDRLVVSLQENESRQRTANDGRRRQDQEIEQ